LAGVNLLPLELRTGRTSRRSLLFPLTFLLLISCLLGAHLRMQGVLAQQEESMTELRTEIASMQQVKLRRELLVRLDGELAAVKNEFARRTMWSGYTDELSARLPFGVVLKDLRGDGSRLTMSATADTLSQVAQFISNVTASAQFKEPSVSQMSVTWSGNRVTRVDFSATIEIIPVRTVRP
jgi:Tfp pilus assembly protein PilN